MTGYFNKSSLLSPQKKEERSSIRLTFRVTYYRDPEQQ
jgi:hypothetical protein